MTTEVGKHSVEVLDRTKKLRVKKYSIRRDGGYWYKVQRKNGKVVKEYLGKERPEHVTAEMEAEIVTGRAASVSVTMLDQDKKQPTRKFTYRLWDTCCHKDNCSCCEHGPYWHLVKRMDGKVTTEYVGKELPPHITADQEKKFLATIPLSVTLNRKAPRQERLANDP